MINLNLANVSVVTSLLSIEETRGTDVLQKNEDFDEIKISFLQSTGPSTLLSYPRNFDILWMLVFFLYFTPKIAIVTNF